MIIRVGFGGYDEYDYIYCPDNISINIDDFFKWIYSDKTHSFWETDKYGERVLCYSGNALCYWINSVLLNEDKDKSYMVAELYSERREYDLEFEF